MPRIPDDMGAFGGGPSIQPRRGIVQGPRDARVDAVADLGATIGKIGEQIQDRDDKLNYSRAKTEYLKQKIQIESSFENDNDYATYGERYKDKIGKARESAVGLIRNPMLRESFQQDTDIDIEQGLAGMAKRAFAEESKHGRAKLSEILANNRELALSTSDPAIRKSFFDETNRALDKALENRYIDPETRQSASRKWAEDFAEGHYKTLGSADEQIAFLNSKDPIAQMIPADKRESFEVQAKLSKDAAFWRGVRLQKHQQAALADELHDRFYRTQDPASVSPEEYERLSPSGQANLRTTVEDTIKGKFRITPVEKYSDLKMMAASQQTRNAFLDLDIEDEIKNFHPTDQKEIRNIYTKLLGGDKDEEKRLDGVWSLSQRIDNTLTESKIKPKDDSAKARFAPLKNEIEREVMRKMGEVKRDLTPPEEQEIIDSALLKHIEEDPVTVFGKNIWTSRDERYSFEVAQEIPDDERQTIANKLREKGIEPNTALIVKYYLQGKNLKAKNGR